LSGEPQAARVEWDERKRLSNIAKHGLDFRNVVSMFDGEHPVVDARPSGDELRERVIGWARGLLAVAIITRRGGVVRVISLRRARESERKQHQALFG
jgi:hypothetical protein